MVRWMHAHKAINGVHATSKPAVDVGRLNSITSKLVGYVGRFQIIRCFRYFNMDYIHNNKMSEH